MKRVITLRVGSFSMKRVITLRVGSFFPEIFLKKIRVYRVKKRSDRQMAPFGEGLASASLRLNVVGPAFNREM